MFTAIATFCVFGLAIIVLAQAALINDYKRKLEEMRYEYLKSTLGATELFDLETGTLVEDELPIEYTLTDKAWGYPPSEVRVDQA